MRQKVLLARSCPQEAVSQTPNAVPARDDLIAPLSYLIALKVGKNRYATLRAEFRQEFDVGQNKCPASNEIGDGEEYQIDLLRLALPIVFTLLFSGAGVAWYFLDKAGKCVTGAKDRDNTKTWRPRQTRICHTTLCPRMPMGF